MRNAADHRNSIFLENKTPFSWKLPLLLGTHHSRRDVIWCHVEIITGKRRLKYFLNNFSFEDVGRNACPKNLQPSTSHSIFHNCHRCGRIGLDYQPLLGKWEESGGNRSYGSIPVLFKYIKNLTKPVLLLVFVFSLTQSNAVFVFPQKRPSPSPPPPPKKKIFHDHELVSTQWLRSFTLKMNQSVTSVHWLMLNIFDAFAVGLSGKKLNSENARKFAIIVVDYWKLSCEK